MDLVCLACLGQEELNIATMRAELSKKKEMIAFVWGATSDVPEGSVRILRFDFNPGSKRFHSEMVNTTYARFYWKNLQDAGFIT